MGILQQIRIVTTQTTCIVPPFVEEEEDLLEGETDGLAVDFTDTTYFDSITDDQDWVQERNSSVDTLQSPHVFFTQSGTSPKYVKTSATTIGWSPHNMFLNSATPATQNVTLVIGFVYTVTVTGAGGGDITGSSGASGTATTGTPATFTATGTTGTFTLTGSLDTIQLNRGAVGTIYLATAGAIVQGLPISYGEGLLVEPAATNLILYSQELNENTVWAPISSAVATNNTASPDGSVTAERLTASAGSAVHYLYTVRTIATSTDHTFSIYAKEGTHRYIALHVSDAVNSGKGILVDLQAGTILSSALTLGSDHTFVSSAISSVGNGWHRISMTYSSTDSTGVCAVEMRPDGSNTSWAPSWSAAGTETVFLWGAQLETGTVATSYIPTLSGSVTRAVDHVHVNTSDFPFSATVGALYFAAIRNIDDTYNSAIQHRYVNFDNGTTGDQFRFEFDETNNDESFFTNFGGGNPGITLDGSTSAAAAGVLVQMSCAWQEDDYAISVDGGANATDVSGSFTLPSGITKMILSNRTGTDRALNGFLRKVVYVPRRVSNGDLPTWRYAA